MSDGYLDPKIVGTVVLCLMVLAVGIFAFYVTSGALSNTTEADQTLTFDRDPSGTTNCDVHITGGDIKSITWEDGTAITTYTYTGHTVTVTG